MTFITIIIPVYNKEKYLDSCLKSVLNQTFRNIEVIIIDDGSTDNSKEVIKHWVKKDKRIRFYTQEENHGVAYTRNKGIEKANGKFIFFIDADDEIENDTIEKLVINETKNGADIILANFSYYLGDNFIRKTSYRKQLIKKEELNLLKTKVEMFLINGRPMSSVCNRLYRHSFLKKNSIMFRDNILAEDRMFNLECYIKGPTISIIEDNTYKINVIQDSRSRTINENYYSESIELVYTLHEIFKMGKKTDNDLLQISLIIEIDKILNYYYKISKNKIKNVYNIIRIIKETKSLTNILYDIIQQKPLSKFRKSRKLHFRTYIFYTLFLKTPIIFATLTYILYKIATNIRLRILQKILQIGFLDKE